MPLQVGEGALAEGMNDLKRSMGLAVNATGPEGLHCGSGMGGAFHVKGNMVAEWSKSRI